MNIYTKNKNQKRKALSLIKSLDKKKAQTIEHLNTVFLVLIRRSTDCIIVSY